MSGNLENDRSVTAGKMYPIDLAQKITIVKSVSNTEVKMTHLIPGQPKTTASGQIIAHTGPVGMMRPAAAILSPSVSSQPQMIVSGSPMLQGTQIVSQGSQIIGPNSQIIPQSQIISSSGQILSPGTQIISQGTQLSAQVSNASNTGPGNAQVTVPSSVSGQVLSVGGLVNSGQALVSGAGNLVVSSSVRTLPPSVRVIPPQTHHPNRPVHVNVSSAGGVLISKGVTSHVPRGLAAGASLAVRPVTPANSAQQVGAWSGSGRGRGALVYGGRAGGAPLPRATPPRGPALASSASIALATNAPAAAQPTHSAIVTLPSTTVLTSSSVISGSLRALTPAPPRAPAAPRPLPLLQRNYQPKVVGVASVGVRGVVGNSAPTQLYYEVPRAAPPHATPHGPTHTPSHGNTHAPPHGNTHVTPHGNTHAPQHGNTHVTPHGNTHGTPHGNTHSTPHGNTHSTAHGNTHATPHSNTHSTPHGNTHVAPHGNAHGPVAPHGPTHVAPHVPTHVPAPQPLTQLPRPLTPYAHAQQAQGW